ncbi:MAG: carboxy-S-adenosyl-L-methionine synthase CmoA [Campylobacterales bacterium]
MPNIDTHFLKPQDKQFEFDASVAPIFDDMLARSVPLYQEGIELASDLMARWVDPGKQVVDLGCSTGTLLLKLHKKSGGKLKLTGIDSAEAMIAQARNKAIAFGAEVAFECKDVADLTYQDLGAVSASYLLQFIRPPKRHALVEKIARWLEPGGLFVFSEKLACPHKKLDKIMIDRYLDYKRERGYSDYEIARKREALENVLIPYSEAENREQALAAGFSHVECVLRWNNFATFVAVK